MSEMEHSKHFKSSNGEEDVKDNVELETHKALLNDVVLQNIFKYLGYKDLRSCRQVGNCQWLRNSKKAWWPRTKVVFKESRLAAFKIKDYLKQTEMTSNAINYKFEIFDEECETSLNFFERFGPAMKYLEIGYGKFQSAEDFRRFMYTQFPNLEKFVLNRFSLRKTTENENVEALTPQETEFGKQTNLKSLQMFGFFFPVSWIELLSHFPNLQDLEVIGSPEVFKAISMICERDPKILKLKHFKTNLSGHGDYDESFRSVLLDKNLSFETIHMSVDGCKPETVVDILDLHAQSLKELRIFGGRRSEIELPRKPLKLLEELDIHNCLFPVNIFKCTPNLKKVNFTSINIKLNQLTPDPELKVKSCKELTLIPNSQWEDTPNSDFEFLLNAFPNVEILETRDINNFRFSMICQFLTKLVSLKVWHTSEVDDIGLLGNDPTSTHNDKNCHPNITNLKDLQTISMSSKTEWVHKGSYMKGTEIRNSSAILKKLEELRHLKKFELKDYELQGDDQIWREIFCKYSGKETKADNCEI